MIHLTPPKRNPRGPDGRGWNRMAIIDIMSDQCALRPTSLASYLDAQDTRRVAYGSYGHCVYQGNCMECPVFCAMESWPWSATSICVRVSDDDDIPWIMNRQSNGWAERGYPTTWEWLLRLSHSIPHTFRDEHGTGIIISHTASEYHDPTGAAAVLELLADDGLFGFVEPAPILRSE